MANLSKFHVVFSSSTLIIRLNKDAFDDVLQITIKFTLEANNKTRANTCYILGHGIE